MQAYVKKCPNWGKEGWALRTVFAMRGPMQETFQLRWTALAAAWRVVVQEGVTEVTAEISSVMYR
jgi:hypothetical protein